MKYLNLRRTAVASLVALSLGMTACSSDDDGPLGGIVPDEVTDTVDGATDGVTDMVDGATDAVGGGLEAPDAASI